MMNGARILVVGVGLVWLAALAVGCGGTDDGALGAPKTTKLIDLTEAEHQAYCQWAFDTSGGWQCSDGTAEDFTAEQCKKPARGCAATLADAERCWTVVRGKCESFDAAVVARECAALAGC